MKDKNKPLTVLTKPTGRVGGTNKEVKVQTKPAVYKGGSNKNLIKIKGK